jgi:hypothetical protein
LVNNRISRWPAPRPVPEPAKYHRLGPILRKSEEDKVAVDCSGRDLGHYKTDIRQELT